MEDGVRRQRLVSVPGDLPGRPSSFRRTAGRRSLPADGRSFGSMISMFVRPVSSSVFRLIDTPSSMSSKVTLPGGLRDDRVGVRIPVGDDLAGFDLVTVADREHRAVGQLVRSRSRWCSSTTPTSPERDTATSSPDSRSTVFRLCRRIVPPCLTWMLSTAVAREAAPPMWKVRMVSCVPGSPMDCAAMTPTASPTLTWWPRARSRP